MSNKEHLKKRKAAAMSIIGQLNNLGLNNEKTDPEGRGTLIQAFVRPRLLYATENCALTKSDIAELVTFEAFIVKHSYGLAGKSMNTPLIAALGITSLERQIKERSMSFLMQLTANIHTREIVLLNDENSRLHNTLQKLNIDWN